MDTLDTWLNFRETTLKEADLGDSIDMVEELIRKHDDFEKAVLAQEGKFGDIKRLTLVGFSRVFLLNLSVILSIKNIMVVEAELYWSPVILSITSRVRPH